VEKVGSDVIGHGIAIKGSRKIPNATLSPGENNFLGVKFRNW
jgi:hypothetical protein